MATHAYSKKNVLRFLLILYTLLFLAALVLDQQILYACFDPNAQFQFQTCHIILLSLTFLCGLTQYIIKHTSWLSFVYQQPFILNTLLCILMLLFPMIILELALRPFTLFVDKDVTLFQRDKSLGWKLKPNTTEEYGEVNVHINNHGFRGYDITTPKPKNTKRIMFLGDSVAFGLRLPFENTFPFMVEKHLEQEFNQSIEILNTGVPGYSIWQESTFFTQKGYHYQPDTVVLSFVLNDVLDCYTYHKFGNYGLDSPIPYIHTSYLEKILHKSSIYLMLNKLIYQFKSKQEALDSAIYQELFKVETLVDRHDHPDIREAWRITKNHIIDIQNECTKRNISFLLVLFPFKFQLTNSDQHSAPQDELLQFTHEHNIHIINLLPILNKRISKNNHEINDYFLDYCHLTPKGNKLTSDLITHAIKKKLFQ